MAYHKTAAALSPFSRTGLTDIEDVVPFIRHLVSEGWWITGQTILINGGYTTATQRPGRRHGDRHLSGKDPMHVTLVIAGGIILLGLFLLFGELWEAGPAPAAGLFLPTWLAVALVNLWVGVQHAGYGLREELPILLLVFLVPAALAGVAIWLAPRRRRRFRRGNARPAAPVPRTARTAGGWPRYPAPNVPPPGRKARAPR